MSCPDCIEKAHSAFNVDLDTSTGEFTVSVSVPGYEARVQGFSKEQVADFTGWASLVREYVRNR